MKVIMIIMMVNGRYNDDSYYDDYDKYDDYGDDYDSGGYCDCGCCD